MDFDVTQATSVLHEIISDRILEALTVKVRVDCAMRNSVSVLGLVRQVGSLTRILAEPGLKPGVATLGHVARTLLILISVVGSQVQEMQDSPHLNSYPS